MCWPSKSEWRGATILERRTRTGIVSCSTSLTFFIASGRWHRWALGCHSSSPGVLSGMGFSRCCGEQMPSARTARPNGRQRPAHTSGLALNRRHARSEEMGAVVASDHRITKVRLVSEGKQSYLNRIRPTGRQAPSPDTPPPPSQKPKLRHDSVDPQARRPPGVLFCGNRPSLLCPPEIPTCAPWATIIPSPCA